MSSSSSARIINRKVGCDSGSNSNGKDDSSMATRSFDTTSPNSLRSFLGTLLTDTTSIVIVEDNAEPTLQQHLQVSQSFRSLQQQSGRARSCRWSSTSTPDNLPMFLPPRGSAAPGRWRMDDPFSPTSNGQTYRNAQWGINPIANGASSSSDALSSRIPVTPVPLTVDASMSCIDASSPVTASSTARWGASTSSSVSFSSSSNTSLRDLSPFQPIRKEHISSTSSSSSIRPPLFSSSARTDTGMNRQNSNISTLSMSDHSSMDNMMYDRIPRPSRRSSMDTTPRLPQRRSVSAVEMAVTKASDVVLTEGGSSHLDHQNYDDNSSSVIKDNHDDDENDSEDDDEFICTGGVNVNADNTESGNSSNKNSNNKGPDVFVKRTVTRKSSSDSSQSHSRRRLESVLGSMAPGKDRSSTTTTSSRRDRNRAHRRQQEQ